MGICPYREVNMRKVFVALTAAFALVAFLSACGIGLEPAKSGSTEVSFTINTLPVVGSDGTVRSNRAIVPGGGYLYVRMIGGPSTDKPFLGPYRVSGTDRVRVSITDIPAGSYDAMFVLLAATEVHTEYVSIDDKEILFADILSLPDVDFIDVVDPDEEEYVENEPDELDMFFKGLASFGFVESPRVRANVTNTFRLSMIPITPYWIDLHHGEGYLYIEEYPGSFRGFVSISGLDALAVSESLGLGVQMMLTITNDGPNVPVPPGALTINRMIAYDGEGKPLATMVSSPVVLNRTKSAQYFAPLASGDEMYLYLEISGGDPYIEIDGGLDLGGSTTVVNTSLNLVDYASNFDEVHTVLFTTSKDLANLDSSTVGYASTDYIDENYQLNGFIRTTAPESVHLVIIGEKFGVPVIYVTEEVFWEEEIYIEDGQAFPVYQYAVVSSAQNYLDSHIGKTMTLEMKSGSTTVAQGMGEVKEVYDVEIGNSLTVAVILLVDVNGDPVVFDDYDYEYVSDSTFSVTVDTYSREHNDNSFNSLEGAFIRVIFGGI